MLSTRAFSMATGFTLNCERQIALGAEHRIGILYGEHHRSQSGCNTSPHRLGMNHIK